MRRLCLAPAPVDAFALTGVPATRAAADPKEKEFLYPPITYLQTMSVSTEGEYTVVEVMPTIA